MIFEQTLSNGVRLITLPLEGTKTASILVLFGVGSRYEEKRLNGISHFIEHMMFKGTKKRPSTLSLLKELDGVGAEYNAYTCKDATGYWIKINAEKLPLAIDIVSDMLYNSLFSQKEIDREKRVVSEEIHMYRDNPMTYIDTLLEKILYEPSSLSWDIAGDEKTVMSFSRDDIIAFRQRHYRGENIVVGVSGQFNEKNTRQLLARAFGRAWKEKEHTSFQSYVRGSSAGPKVLLHYKETEQAQIDMGFHGYPHSHKDIAAASLLATLLGRTMSSRLFISVRERHGLCYSIQAGHQPFQDTGVFFVQSGLDTKRIKKALTLILKELEKVKKNGVTQAELRRAKDHVRGKMALQFEDSENVVSWYVTQKLLTNAMLTPEEKLAKLEAVTTHDISRVAQKLFQTKNIHLAVIGPFKDENFFLPLLKIT